MLHNLPWKKLDFPEPLAPTADKEPRVSVSSPPVLTKGYPALAHNIDFGVEIHGVGLVLVALEAFDKNLHRQPSKSKLVRSCKIKYFLS